MSGLTRNLFWGQGERSHRLVVTDGHWPTDMAGSVFIVGPDKRRPGGHWFAEQGLLARIRLQPDAAGRVAVDHRVVDTRVARLRRRLPFLFAKVRFMELSPFGVSNFANTNVQPIDDRLFVGYDAGRPIEVDPVTMEVITPVGANDEWLQGAPGILEPLCAVAAHPAADVEESSLYFLNYSQLSPPGVAADAYLACWDLAGDVHRWKLEGMSPFDSIHDVKATRDHLVFTDLPFVVEPETFRGAARSLANQQHTTLWIVAKQALRDTPPGGAVDVTEVKIPMPTGHLGVDHDEVDGLLRVVLQHMPLADLMIPLTRDSTTHHTGAAIDPNYEGLVSLAVQPTVVGRYLIDPASGHVVEADTVVDESCAWGGLLATADTHRSAARAHQRQLWFAGVGFDPDLVNDEWWALYGDSTDGVVAPADLPDAPIPGALTRIDLDAMKFAEIWTYDDGAFPSPPTFVPRQGTDDPDDGYVVVVVHRDGPKAIEVFDANDIGAGPLATASSPTFNPGLLLHSCWMPDRVGPRRSTYRVPVWRDVLGAVRGLPGVIRSFVSMGRAMRSARSPRHRGPDPADRP